MYPHEIDRLRILQFILKRLREPLKQNELEARSGVPQSTISQLENLAGQAKVGRSARRNLLAVVGHGLHLPRVDVDALLWLFDGNPLSSREVAQVIRSYDPNAVEGDYVGEETTLRKNV